MKRIAVLCVILALLAGTAVAQPPAGPAPSGADSSAAVNMAVVAQPSSSNVSGDTTLTALNDGINPRSSRGGRGGSYGNWPSRGTQWVQYDWSQPICTNKIDVYWWADGQGIGAPQTCRLLYWNGSAFVPVADANGLGVALNQFNTTTFKEVTTAKLKLEIDSAGELSTGILEWKVYDSGKSPDFPPTVTAGIDRLVVLGGKTYLNGTVKALKGDAGSAKLTWSKESGPGTVTFEKADAAVTTATFSAAGDYVLKLSAGAGNLASSSTLKVTAVTPPPADRLDVVYTKKYKIDSPLWNARAKALIVSWIPHCIDQINDPNLRQGPGGIDNFVAAAAAMKAEPYTAHKGYVFSNAWVHQTVESMCIALMVDPQGDPDIIKAQEKMKKTLEDWIPKILAAQEPDGYLQTAFTARSGMFFSVEELLPRPPAAGFRGMTQGTVALPARPVLAAKLKNPANAAATYIRDKLSASTLQMLASWTDPNDPSKVPEELNAKLVADLNQIVKGPLIWNEQTFARVNVRQVVRDHLTSKLLPGDLARLNRLLIEDALGLVPAGGRGGRGGGQDIWMDRWSPAYRGNHEGYVAGYFIESAINHYTLTNGTDKRLYDAAKKLADCWVANIGPGKKAWYDGHQQMEQGLVRFGRFVNDMEGPGSHGTSYIQLAKFLLDCRNNGSEYDQSHVPVQQQYEAVGHAVRASYNYSAMADVAAETHDLDYQSAVMSLWDSMVNKKYYVTGGIGSGETSEGFGPDYSLRNEAYCESCSTCGLIFFQHKMNIAYHDAKYADLYEESMYNALLGATDLAGTVFYYTNPLTGGMRTAWHNCPCCVGNIPRTLLMIPTWTYVKGKDGIYVNMFVGSTINVEKVAGTDIEMVQKTDYPWSGNVSITVNPKKAGKFTVYVRVPNRTTSVLYTPTPQVSGLKSIAVNGAPVTPKIANGYAAIEREWKAGDKIDLVLPMEVQKIKADDKIAADRGLVALRYGPLIYNVERADNQDITQALAPNATFTTEWQKDLLSGVLVIKSKWADGSTLTAIPNYARNNRNTPGPGARGRMGGGDSGIDYSGGATVGTTGAGAAGGTNPPANAAGARRGGRGGPRPSSSMVWFKAQ